MLARITALSRKANTVLGEIMERQNYVIFKELGFFEVFRKGGLRSSMASGHSLSRWF